MAGTYGAAGTNPYTIKGVGGILSNEVNAETGVTQIYRQDSYLNPLVGKPVFTSLGTYNPTTKKFTQDPNTKGSLDESELKAISSPEGTKQIANAATQTAQKAGVTNPQKLLSPNTSTANGESTNGQGVDLNASQSNLDKLKISDSDKTRKVNEYPANQYLKYPVNLDTNKQDYIRFTMLEYAPKGINLSSIAKGDPFAERSTEGKRRGNSVILPIQPSISDSNTVQWGSDEMNAAQAIAAAGALGTITGGAEGAGTAIQASADLLTGASPDIKSAFAAGFADKAAGTKGLLTRTTGGIINPNMELLFQGPNLRGFSFTFSLSAREETEAKHIRNIIRFFKQGMSVKRASTGLFLKSPNTFEIKYMIGTKEHPWINKIKECALTAFNVNYTPAGNYATFYDGAMTQYDISMQFSELEPVYDDDYGKGSTTFESEIGY